MEKECRYKSVGCGFVSVGCNARMMVSERDRHERKAVTKHVQCMKEHMLKGAHDMERLVSTLTRLQGSMERMKQAMATGFVSKLRK